MPAAADAPASRNTSASQMQLFGDGEPPASTPRRRPWAWLLRHVFALDVTVCPVCSGPMRWREIATSAEDVARVLARHPHEA